MVFQGNVEDTEENAVLLFDEKCHSINGEKVFTLSKPLYKYYMAKACVVGRENDVCGSFASKYATLIING